MQWEADEPKAEAREQHDGGDTDEKEPDARGQAQEGQLGQAVPFGAPLQHPVVISDISNAARSKHVVGTDFPGQASVATPPKLYCVHVVAIDERPVRSRAPPPERRRSAGR